MKFLFKKSSLLFSLCLLFSNFIFSQNPEVTMDIETEGREYVEIIDNSSVRFTEKNPYSGDMISKINPEKVTIAYSESETIPLEIFNLKGVSELFILMSNLKRIPPDISKFENLKKLVIDCRKLESIPDEIFQLQQLKLLKIIGDFPEVPDEISNLSNLTNLIISSSNKNFSNLTSQVYNFPKLEELSLWIYYAKNFPSEIKNLSALITLEINNTHFKIFPVGIENCLNLREITISTNELDSFPKSFSELKNLKEIEFSAGHLDSLGKMPSFNFKSESLRTIVVNSFERYPIKFSNLNDFPKLETLRLFSVKVDDFRSFSFCPNLKEIRIFNGDLSEIPKEILSLEKLQKLYLRKNNIEEVPVSFFENNKMKKIYLYRNPIIDNNPELFMNAVNYDY